MPLGYLFQKFHNLVGAVAHGRPLDFARSAKITHGL